MENKESKLWQLENDVPGQTEDELQMKCVTWFWNNYPRHRGCLFSVPNGGLRNKREAARLKQTGLTPGVSDLILAVNGQVYFIELKTETGRQNKAQVKFEILMLRESLPYIIINSLERFKSTVSNIMIY